MFFLELLLGKVIDLFVKIIDKNKGTKISGEIILKFDKNFIKKFRNIDYSKVIVITGTNGKSTTTNFLYHLFTSNNKKVVSNLEGANLITGIATSLIKNSDILGRIKDAYFIFEVDERTLSTFLENIPAQNIAVTNIQKDQVCRNGDPDYIFRILKKNINENMTLFLNNNDPRSKALETLTKNIIYYGVSKNEESYTLNNKLAVTMPCPMCQHKINFSYYNISNIGKFKCSNCNFKSEKNIKYEINNVNLKNGTFKILNQIIKMPYKSSFMLYNYALSFAIADYFKINNIEQAFPNFKNIKGRIETLNYKNKKIKYIRLKQENPETLQSCLDYVAKDNKEKIIILGLCLIKDFKPYYSNTFYSYDCDFDKLINSNVKKFICFSKYVAYDTANRLFYANVDKEKVVIINNDNVSEILNEVDKCKIKNIYLITWIKTYEDILKFLEGGN